MHCVAVHACAGVTAAAQPGASNTSCQAYTGNIDTSQLADTTRIQLQLSTGIWHMQLLHAATKQYIQQHNKVLAQHHSNQAAGTPVTNNARVLQQLPTSILRLQALATPNLTRATSSECLYSSNIRTQQHAEVAK
jgi:hypothetical protein